MFWPATENKIVLFIPDIHLIYLGMSATNQNLIHKEINSRLKLGNDIIQFKTFRLLV
jgi:hypothetical protein